MGFWSDLLGTSETAFRIGKAKSKLDAGALTAARTHTLPDASGTLALTSQLSGANAGTVTLTFGADVSMARTTVANAAISATSVPQFVPGSTASHNNDEHTVEQYDLKVAKIIPGVSFDVVMLARGKGRLHGSWQFKYVF